jgi:hypothetical protein
MLKSQKFSYSIHKRRINKWKENVVVSSRMFSRGIMGYRTKYKGSSNLAILEELVL